MGEEQKRRFLREPLVRVSKLPTNSSSTTFAALIPVDTLRFPPFFYFPDYPPSAPEQPHPLHTLLLSSVSSELSPSEPHSQSRDSPSHTPPLPGASTTSLQYTTPAFNQIVTRPCPLGCLFSSRAPPSGACASFSNCGLFLVFAKLLSSFYIVPSALGPCRSSSTSCFRILPRLRGSYMTLAGSRCLRAYAICSARPRALALSTGRGDWRELAGP